MIKSFVINVLFPFPLLFYVTLASTALLWMKKTRPAKALCTLAVFILMTTALPFFSDPFVTSWEGRYVRLSDDEIMAQKDRIPYIVVLGSGYSGRSDLPPTARHSPSQLFRLIEGMRLHRLLPEARLIVSGGGGHPTEAQGMSDLLEALGVDKEKILLEARSRNTYEEAVFIKDMIGEAPLLLVTSAVHMPRSVALFERAGLKPIPSPADYLVSSDRPSRALTPSADALRGFETALYERIGWLKERLLRRI